MDLDAFRAAHQDEWSKLDALAKQGGLDGREADELIDRYQLAASQLSAMTSTAGSTRDSDKLSVTLSRARLRFTGVPGNLLRQIPSFFVAQLPAALYRLRWLTLAAAVFTIVVAGLYAIWAAGDPRVMANLGSTDELRKFAEEDFINYYSENPAASFMGQVWTNNAWIAAQCIAFGITGIFVPYVLLTNAQGLGINAAVLFHTGHGDTFFLYILPHGLLELTAVFVAAAAGIRIFWAWIAPGARTRGQALAEDARALFTVALGLVVVLFVSGIIEGFVTPQPWPWAIKIGIGVLALGSFLAYLLVLGRRAYLAGETGDLAEYEAGAKQLIAG